MSCRVTPNVVEEVFKRWRGNGKGKTSLYRLAEDFNLHINDLYALLSTPYGDALRRAKQGKVFSSLGKI